MFCNIKEDICDDFTLTSDQKFIITWARDLPNGLKLSNKELARRFKCSRTTVIRMIADLLEHKRITIKNAGTCARIILPPKATGDTDPL